MAKNEPNKPEDVKTTPAKETPAEEKATSAPPPDLGGKPLAPDLTAKEATTDANKGKSTLHDKGDNGLKPPPPLDIPTPDGGVVVSFDKINEIVAGKQTASKEAGKATPQKQEVGKNTPTDKMQKSDEKAPKSKDAGQKQEKPPMKAAQKDKPPSRQPKAAEKADKKPADPKEQEKPQKDAKPDKPKQTGGVGGGSISGKGSEQPKQSKQEVPPPAPVQSPAPKEAPRPGEKEQIVYLNLSELHAFKDHPFQVRQDDEMTAMVESVKDKGVTQPAIVRPREDGGYEIISGHRRQKASELAGYADMPCIVRDLTDEQAITQMVEDNTNQRENILPSERAKALKMQLEAIKKQGSRTGNGQRSNEVVAERNKMTVKQVQRYIKLNELVPDLAKMVDEKRIAFTPAVELAFITPKNQQYVAIAIEGQQSAPSLSQAQRMRDLDQKKLLSPDVIDGIMLEEKKEVDKVIISSQELSQYFGKEKTPREMKDTIMKLLEDNKDKLKDISAPEKKTAHEK